MTRFTNSLAQTGAAALLAALAVIIAPTAARAAPTVVTACGRDDAAGGINLVQALAVGGEIVIRCAPGAQIQITSTRVIRAGTSIDGEGKAFLTGTLKGPLFTVGVGSVTLRNLRIAAPRDASTSGSPNAGMILEARNGSIRLENVHSEDARNAYSAIGFTARGSKFTNMGDDAAGRAAGFVIDAERADLRNVEVSGGSDHPLGGGNVPLPGRAPFARQVLIEDSLFKGNSGGLLINDATVTVRRTTFVGNGRAAEPGSAFWGCCGGALTLVHSRARLEGVTFRSNQSSGFGGAIHALASSLDLADVLFEDNHARVGGAVMAWGLPPLFHSWGALAPGAPSLAMTRTRFLANDASSFGGGLVFAGRVEGSAVLFARNRAPDGAGIAHWRAIALAPPHQFVFAGLGDASGAAPDLLFLARPIFVGNEARSGAAILGGPADVRLGNSLIVRNGIANGSSTGPVLTGDRLSIVNSSIVENWNPGLALAPAAQVRLANSILSRNRGGNCVLGGSAMLVAPSLQFPGMTCGTAIASRDPGLGHDYSPGLLSAARGSGDVGTCAADPLVRGVDVYGDARLKGGKCDLGAIERDLLASVASSLPFGFDQPAKRHCLILILVAIFIIVFLIVFVLVWRRRRRRAAASREANLPKG